MATFAWVIKEQEKDPPVLRLSFSSILVLDLKNPIHGLILVVTKKEHPGLFCYFCSG